MARTHVSPATALQPHLSLLALATLMVLALSAAWGCAPTAGGASPVAGGSPGPGRAAPEDPPLNGGKESWGPEATWVEVVRLIDEQKFQAASELVRGLLTEARERLDTENWTRALIELVQLETGLHGYEKAVRLLRREPWPDDALSIAALELYYGQGLVHYLQVYSWEIRQREQVATSEEVDLEAWTAQEIVAEADRAYGRVWATRVELGQLELDALSPYLIPNNYPEGLRGTLRDAVTYLWVELLGNSSFWSARESNQTYRLDLHALLADAKSAEVVNSKPNDQHPISKLTELLSDLEHWHLSADRPEAAFEGRLERLRRLHAAFSQAADRDSIVDDLRSRLDDLGREHPWWSMGVSQLAEFVKAKTDPWALAEARRLAEDGVEAHPGSIGAGRCRHIIAAIEAPAYSITAMSTDGAARRSIEVRHKNIETLYFRAFSLDLFDVVDKSQDYNLLPGYNEIEKMISGRSPAAAWHASLPDTPDYREHRSFVVPDLDDSGFYLIVASARSSFDKQDNELKALYLNRSDLVLVSRPERGNLEVTAVSGSSGEAIPRADVYLYRYDYRRKGHRRVETQRTGMNGNVVFDRGGDGERYFLLARHGSDVALDPRRRYFSDPVEESRTSGSFVYTDRSIYRPGQEIQWKVVGYGGNSSQGDFRVLENRSVTVQLFDANGEVVNQVAVRTNDHGSATGAFEIPSGRLLGGWSLGSSLGGRASIRVEEYKRPTFEAALETPEKALRLNRDARVSGEARYYFGLPVVDGEVDWRVTREPVYPYWWWWYYPAAGSDLQTVASGSTRLDDDGAFTLEFLPEADERQAKQGVSYRFRVAVEVTDSGGETSKVEKAFHLGFVTVQTRIASEREYVVAGSKPTFSLAREDLDGAARAGSASWRLTRLEQPSKTLLPADLALPEPPSDSSSSKPAFSTPGDRLRTRWQGRVSVPQILRFWGDEQELAAGNLSHANDGWAEVVLEPLEPGAYRLHYSTRDAFGAEFETTSEFVVVAPRTTRLAVPALLLAESPAVAVGETARLLVHSGLDQQRMVLEVFRRGKRLRREVLDSGHGLQLLEFPITEADRGGIGFRLTLLRDHQMMTLQDSIFVPWDNKKLEIEFETFRDYLRPGGRETWRVKASGGELGLAEGSAELLAYMYDRSLDVFAPHVPPDPMSIYPRWGVAPAVSSNLGPSAAVWRVGSLASLPGYAGLYGDRLNFLSGYGIGGMGRHAGGRVRAMQRGMVMESMALPASVPAREDDLRGLGYLGDASDANETSENEVEKSDALAASEPAGLRTNFSETAFWEPHLLLDPDGSVSFEFEVPDSVTEWNVWVHAVTNHLRVGRLTAQVKTVKELLVRPYLPRFLREGDRAELRVVVQNAGDDILSGELDFEILDAATQESLLAAFGVERPLAGEREFKIEPGKSRTYTVAVDTPARLGEVAFKVLGKAADLTDGELRPLPVLPGRMHLAQSRFVTLSDRDRKTLHFADLARDDDLTRIDEQLVITLDTQLFYSVLSALPYLVNYPYECTEQTLNRFLSTGIVSTLYDDYPAVKRMARRFSERDTQYEAWQADDPNRKMALEETPWVAVSKGGGEPTENLINVLDPAIAQARRKSALAQLRKAQTSIGGFPWFPGGPPSPFMTLYLLNGFSRALEFGVEVPKPMIRRAWSYLHRHYIDNVVDHMIEDECCWEFVTFLNYVLSSYPDESWTGGVFTGDERRRMLDFSFAHWKSHSPLSKAQLALTLQREGWSKDAKFVFDSVMDSSKTTEELGTYWAPQDRAWLWYNDTIETHAFALRALTELNQDDSRRAGLVQWLLLNKKLNHWKSTRATAEVVYSLVHYLEHERTLAAREEVSVAIGSRDPRVFVFEPDEYTGENNQIVVAGPDVEPATDSTVVVEKETPGLAFASATWHFSTEELPDEARGDFFEAHRSYFRRVSGPDGWRLEPLAVGTRVEVGDQVEVHVSIRTKRAAEYVHLRDPRPAGFEPERSTSGYKWDLGLVRYEEVRDSGMNFFFERLPVGEYNMKHRLRAATAGTFQSAPATLQSMYAPEFTAYSSGVRLTIAP